MTSFATCCSSYRWITGVILSLAVMLSHSENIAAQSQRLPATSLPATSFPRAVVAADHVAASEAGAKILKQGGNAVDAAVATSFALSVVRPASCGIGGGGFMVIWNAEQQRAIAIDYRERAPAAVTAAKLLDDASSPTLEPKSVRGGLAVGIPGTVAGLCYAAEKYGTLPIATLVQPAIDLCRDGVTIDEHDLEVQGSALQKLKKFDGYEQRFQSLRDQYLNGGATFKSGQRFHSPQLAVLQLIAQHGAAGFYEGDVADAIVSTVTSEQGALTLEDLKTFQPTEREALTASFQGRTIITMPPPSSGGVALLQTLQSLESWERHSGKTLKSLGHNSLDYVHVTTEALKHAFADRAEFLGDSDFVSVPLTKLLDREYADRIAEKIDLQKTQPMASYGRFFLPADGGTSHFSVMDSSGNAVACTETINLTFGSFVVVPAYGVLLNNQMDDFTANPGKPNAFGLIQSKANAIEPGKKPLSSMTPTIVMENGKATYACGASGGPRIITASLQNLLNHVVFEMTPQQAVSSPRFHHQWSPDELLLEPALETSIGLALRLRGHVVLRSSSLAATQAASLNDGAVSGGSDPRKHGQPAGH